MTGGEVTSLIEAFFELLTEFVKGFFRQVGTLLRGDPEERAVGALILLVAVILFFMLMFYIAGILRSALGPLSG